MEKRLYRSTTDRMVAGVAGGLADYFSIDPVIVRALFVLAIFFDGFGILVYLILAIILPEKPATNEQSEKTITNRKNILQEQNIRMLFGSLLVIGGTLLLAKNFIGSLDLERFWPLLLILAGGLFLYRSVKK